MATCSGIPISRPQATRSENVPAQSIDATRRYWWYVAIAYSLPIAIAFPMCFEAIWYGTGMIGTAGRVFQSYSMSPVRTSLVCLDFWDYATAIGSPACSPRLYGAGIRHPHGPVGYTMHQITPFSEDYASARQRLLRAAKQLDWSIESHSIGVPGPTGEELCLDIVSDPGENWKTGSLLFRPAFMGLRAFSGLASTCSFREVENTLASKDEVRVYSCYESLWIRMAPSLR